MSRRGGIGWCLGLNSVQFLESNGLLFQCVPTMSGIPLANPLVPVQAKAGMCL